MSRQEYMSKLIEALSSFDEDIRTEIINDYEDHFVNGLKSGKSEDEIAEELGSIEELVSDLNALSGRTENQEAGATENGEAGKEEDAKKGSFSEEASAKINDVIKSFASLIGEMAAGVSKGTEKVSSSVGGGAKDFASGAKDFANNFASGFMKGYENIANGVGNVADKVADKTSKFAKEVSDSYRRSMNLPPKEEKTDGEDADTKDFDDFEVDDIADNLSKKFSDAVEEITSKAFGNDDAEDDESGEFYSFSDDVENVVIEVEGAEVYLDSSDDDTLTFNYENEGNPNQQLAYRLDLKQKGKTVYATVKKQPGLSNFFQTLGCPDISLYVGIKDSIRKASVRTMSGEVTANEIDVEQLTINSMSGDINVEDCSITTMELSTMSGDIDVSLDEGSAATVSSISGDIGFSGSCESIHAKTTSGDISFTIDNENSDITASSVSGDIDVELSNDSGYVANVKSTAGAINLSCGDEDKEITRSGSYIMGDGGAKLSLSSISGDIDVEA